MARAGIIGTASRPEPSRRLAHSRDLADFLKQATPRGRAWPNSEDCESQPSQCGLQCGLRGRWPFCEEGSVLPLKNVQGKSSHSSLTYLPAVYAIAAPDGRGEPLNTKAGGPWPREIVLAGERTVKGFIESRAAVLCEEDDDFPPDVLDLPLKALTTERVACRVFARGLCITDDGAGAPRACSLILPISVRPRRACLRR